MQRMRYAVEYVLLLSFITLACRLHYVDKTYAKDGLVPMPDGADNDVFSFALPPSLSVGDVEGVAQWLKQELPGNGGVVTLDASLVEVAGIPAVQLVLAAAKQCEQRGLIFLITRPAEALRQAFRDAGLADWFMQREAS